MPSSKEMFQDFSKTLSGALNTYRKQGVILADGDSAYNRSEICSACEHLGAGNRCKLCGCIMTLKWRILAAKCPISKW